MNRRAFEALKAVNPTFWDVRWQNADPDVRKDMETFLSKVAVPEVR